MTQRTSHRISTDAGVPCPSCPQCLAGRFNLRPDVRFFASAPYDGAVSQYVAAPAACVYAVPDSISHGAAGGWGPLAVGVWECLFARQVARASSVLVTGAGPIAALTAARSDPTTVKGIVRPGD